MIDSALLRKYSKQTAPFTLHLKDGRKINVPRGDYISVRPEGGVFVIWKARGDFEFIKLTSVAAVEVPS